MVSIVNAAPLETRPTIKMATTITNRPTVGIRSARHFDNSSAGYPADLMLALHVLDFRQ
jgi:hypothetical protein